MLVGVVRTVGASRGATGGVVTEGVDVHAALSVGICYIVMSILEIRHSHPLKVCTMAVNLP